MHYDVIVVGLGAMGSATAYQLARRGRRVLGLEAFARGHELGSSGGLTRIIRQAYFEHPDYVPLLRTAWAMWPELEAESGRLLMLKTGGLYAGRRGSSVLEGALASARQHELPHDLMSAAEVSERFPAFQLDGDMVALYEELAGLLYPDRCIDAHLDLAEHHGAELRFDERVTRWNGGGVVEVETEGGRYTADRLVLAAGAWLPKLVPDLALPLSVTRQPVFWLEPVDDGALLGPDRLPVYIVELDSDHSFYGFPVLPGQGAKIARHHGGRVSDPDSLERGVDDADEEPVRRFIERYLPPANGRRLDARVCMYTSTPDFHFIVDFHPADERVVLCSPCSGHGFKFSNVMGAIAADLATAGRTEHEIGFLSLRRFATGARA